MPFTFAFNFANCATRFFVFYWWQNPWLSFKKKEEEEKAIVFRLLGTSPKISSTLMAVARRTHKKESICLLLLFNGPLMAPWIGWIWEKGGSDKTNEGKLQKSFFLLSWVKVYGGTFIKICWFWAFFLTIQLFISREKFQYHRFWLTSSARFQFNLSLMLYLLRQRWKENKNLKNLFSLFNLLLFFPPSLFACVSKEHCFHKPPTMMPFQLFKHQPRQLLSEERLFIKRKQTVEQGILERCLKVTVNLH